METMKTDIVIPTTIYESSQHLAQQLDMSLSEFFLAALTTYIARYHGDDVTEQLNRVYASEVSSVGPEIMSIQMASLCSKLSLLINGL